MSTYPLFFPQDYDEEKSTIVCVPVAFVPVLRDAFKVLQWRSTWATRESWWRGYQVSAEMEEMLLTSCIGQRLDDLLVLLGHATGLTDGATLAQIKLALPALGERLETIETDELDTAGKLESEIARYPAAGIIDAGWFGWGGRKTKLSDVVEALRVGTTADQQQINSTVSDILNDLANAASIGNLLLNLWNTLAARTTEGGIFAVLLASTIANAIIAGQQSAQLDRIIKALDGGALSAPGDDILTALRGTVEANAQRNVLDQMNSNDLSLQLDAIILELQKIHSSNADLGDLLAKLEEIRQLVV